MPQNWDYYSSLSTEHVNISQVMARANFDADLCHHMASLGHGKFKLKSYKLHFCRIACALVLHSWLGTGQYCQSPHHGLQVGF